MTTKIYSGVCMALIRKLGDYKFYPTTFSLDLTSTKHSVKGKLAPGRSDRSLVLLINPGIDRADVLSALKNAAAFIRKNKPGAVNVLAVPLDKKQSPALGTASLVADEAATLAIDGKKQLDEPLSVLPYSIVYAPATLRHWQDAYDDLRAVAEAIDGAQLPRGFITTPLGVLTVVQDDLGTQVVSSARW
jgi:hypothetical protein